MNKISQRQHEILEHFLARKKELCIEELAAELGISRTAVQEHFGALETAGYIEKHAATKTAGRPISLYAITNKGINHFPKHYGWFANLMLDDLLDTISVEESEKYMRHLGEKLAVQLLSQFENKTMPERLVELTAVLNELGFVVEQKINEQNKPCLQACNCILHDLAQKHLQICQFDLALMSQVLGEKVEQSRCMAKGDTVCEFHLAQKP
jgi:DeoR family transcriptional regulator, suf operon transcriptional repressor